jgi:hypothetical protein
MFVGAWPSFSIPLLHSQTPPFYPFGPQRLMSVARNNLEPSYLARTSNAPTQREALSESKNTPLAHISSCINHTSVFFQVLVTPYIPPLPKQPNTRAPSEPRENELYSSFVGWSRQPVRADSPESNHPDKQAVLSVFEHKDKLLYKAHGQWTWADGLPINDSIVLSHLGSKCVIWTRGSQFR